MLKNDKIRLVFDGWNEGMMKVSASMMLREKTSLDLKEAKDIVDRILEDEVVMIDVSSKERADEILMKARQLGLRCHLEKGDGGGSGLKY